MNIIFDGNYLFHKSFSVFSNYYRGQNMKEVLANKENQQVLIRKCIIDFCYTINQFNGIINNVVFVFDTRSWRYMFYDDYKFALTKVKEDWYSDFISIMLDFQQFLKNKGIIVSVVDGAEGDDLMYMWSMYYSNFSDNEKCVIITGDSDIRQMITKNISVLNSNSHNLKLYCVKENEQEWLKFFDIDVIVVNPIDILLYKVIMGDGSDNIKKLKKGFGDKAFEKFLDFIKEDRIDDVYEFSCNKLSDYIYIKFCNYNDIRQDENMYKQVLFNLKMTWLNFNVYEECCNKLLIEMINNINLNKNSYSYDNTKKFTLENFYGMLIK